MANSKTGSGDVKMPKVNQVSNKILPWAVFIPTLVIVLISIISVIFPALVIRTTSPFHSDILETEVIDPFTPGFLAVPLIITNVLVLGIGVAYYKGIKVNNILKKISSFEVSKKQAAIGIIIILAIFCAITAGTLAKEETWEDYKRVKERLQSWTISDFTHSFEPHVKYLLLSGSLHIFGNIRAIPFITSIALLLLVYFFTANITQKKFAGIISMAVLLQSDIFVSYSTTASYDNSWIALYLFSLYMIQRFWQSSPVPYFISIFSKALTVAFLPMSLYFIARSSLSRRSKVYSLASYGIIVIILASSFVIFKKILPGGDTGFNDVEFWQGFSAMAMQMRFDYVILIFLLPLTVMLFFASRRGVLHADSIMIMILGMLLTSPFLVAITNQTNQPYRFVSLAVFFAVGVGVLLSNRTRKQVEV
ncbi:MAG: hypothetical protein KGI10_03530 [Thaumarchaeota archaeon]|nr:hypothetical protein [Nitrososphaerota archaeon]